MFYCEKCAKENDYPESFHGSKGRCEICEEFANCFDVPSSYIFQRKKVKEEETRKAGK